MKQRARYRITIEDLQAGTSRKFSAPVVLETLTSRVLVGATLGNDLTLNCRYVSAVVGKRKNTGKGNHAPAAVLGKQEVQ